MAKAIRADQAFRAVSRFLLRTYPGTAKIAGTSVADQSSEEPFDSGQALEAITVRLETYIKRACKAARVRFPPSAAEWQMIGVAAVASMYMARPRRRGAPTKWKHDALLQLASQADSLAQKHPGWTDQKLSEELLKTAPYRLLTGRRRAPIKATTLQRRLSDGRRLTRQSRER